MALRGYTMITKALLKSGPVASCVAPVARPRRGRPALIPPRLAVVHPVDARRVLTIPAPTVAAWCGVSRQTAARWCADPATVPVAAARLCALYAHGLPPIPPDAWADKSAAGWLQFSFYFDTDQARRRIGQPVGQWLLAVPGQRPANWQQVHALFCSLPQAAALADRCRRLEARAQAAEREAARLADLVANQ